MIKKPISIYIHIPFCNSKCYYCSFISSVQNDQIKEQYFKALEQEISEFNLSGDYIAKTIYIGGGTPSSVDPKFIEDTLNTLRSKFEVDENVEITIECNPNSTDEKKLAYYKKVGVNRLSFGVQSFNKRSLKFVGRIQNNKKLLNDYKKNAINILKIAKKLEFNNISADFILGLPYQKTSQIKHFLKKLSKLVTHFSCYMLMVEEGTKLAEILPDGVSDEKLAMQYEVTVKVLKKLNFQRYEISNFAKKEFESKHNKVYWNMGEYLGFGLASHSFYNNQRVENTENLKDYIDFYEQKRSSKFKIEKSENENKSENIKDKGCEKTVVISNEVGEFKEIKTIESLSKEQLAEETIMLALRTKTGLNLTDFRERFYDIEKVKMSKLAFLLNNGFIKYENNFLMLSDKGILVSNKIILELVS